MADTDFIPDRDWRPAGLQDSRSVLSEQQAQKAQPIWVEWPSSPALVTLIDDWAFYSYAVLYSVSGLKLDVLAEFCADAGVAPRVSYRQFRRPLFDNVPPQWSSLLWAMERRHWEDFRQWVNTFNVYDRSKNVMWRGGVQSGVSIADPVAVEATSGFVLSRTPLAQCAMFCVDAAHACWYLKQPEDPRLANPSMIRVAPLTDTALEFSVVCDLYQRPQHVREALLPATKPTIEWRKE